MLGGAIQRFGTLTMENSTISDYVPRHGLPMAEAEPKEQEASAPPEAAEKAETKKERTPRVDWAGLQRKSFALEVLPSRPAKLAPAQGPPQRAWC